MSYVVESGRLPVQPPLVGYHLDQPVPGPFEGDLILAGWIVASSGAVRIIARDAAGRLAEIPADRPRPDIAEAFPDAEYADRSGFRLRFPAQMLEDIAEIRLYAHAAGAEVPFWSVRVGTSSRGSADPVVKRPSWARRLIGRNGAEQPPAPVSESARRSDADSFRVVAIISAFNEADIIDAVLAHLAENDVTAYLIDNGSTDDTVAVARRWLGRGLLAIESMPPGDDGRTSWKAILARKLELSRELGADWYLHHDADEIRETPWPRLTMHEAIKQVDRLGYNAIDYRVVNFPPVDDAFRPGDDPRDHFTRWEESAEYDGPHCSCWKAGFPDVALEDAGRDVRFNERRLFPLRFLLRHYPVRGQAHGTRKVLRERKERFAADELAIGWHQQYAHVRGVDYLFMKNPASLRPFDLERIRLDTVLMDGRNSPSPDPDAHTQDADARGVLDQVSPTSISGWAVRGDGNGESVAVEVWDGARLVAIVAADEHRPDLERAEIGAGRAGFSLRTPRELLDGRPHWIWATAAGTALGRSPIVLSSAARPAVTVAAAEDDAASVD